MPESSIYIAAELIPETKRHAWLSSCLDHLQSLKQFTSIEEDKAGSPERRQGASEVHKSNSLPHTTGQITIFNFHLPHRAIGAVEAHKRIQPAASNFVTPRHMEIADPAGKGKDQDPLVSERKRSRAEDDSPRDVEGAQDSPSKHARTTFQQSPGTGNPWFIHALEVDATQL